MTHHKQNIGKLALGRVDLMALDEISFWYQVSLMEEYAATDFEKSFALTALFANSYLVANKSTSEKVVKRLREAWKSIKKSGKYDAIIKSYLEGEVPEKEDW